MKKILSLILATVSISVAAETWRTQNNGGGEIVLTTSQCTEKSMPDLKLGYSYVKNDMFWFCWTIIDSDVLAIFLDDNSTKRYAANQFYKAK